MGSVGILNVGAGDTKLVFDPANPAETIRAGRIVKDMMRRGYALLVGIDDGRGGTTYQRALDFDPTKSEYIIADFDPEVGHTEEETLGGAEDQTAARTGAEAPKGPKPKKQYAKHGRRRIAAETVQAVAVGRSAGG